MKSREAIVTCPFIKLIFSLLSIVLWVQCEKEPANLISDDNFLKALMQVGLNCVSNQLTDLNIANNTSSKYLRCGRNQLTILDISNNAGITELKLMEMPSLMKVCVWTTPFPPEVVNVNITGSPNVYFTTDCS